MSKLQSLYFKLNPENPKHKFIIDFFQNNNEVNKIDLLYYLCRVFRSTAQAAKHMDFSSKYPNVHKDN